MWYVDTYLSLHPHGVCLHIRIPQVLAEVDSDSQFLHHETPLSCQIIAHFVHKSRIFVRYLCSVYVVKAWKPDAVVLYRCVSYRIRGFYRYFRYRYRRSGFK
jgi:hypothetical protein